MYKAYKLNYSNSDPVVNVHKNLTSILEDAFNDNWCSNCLVYTKRNLCGSRNSVCICSFDIAHNALFIREVANDSEVNAIFRFAAYLHKHHFNCDVLHFSNATYREAIDDEE